MYLSLFAVSIALLISACAAPLQQDRPASINPVTTEPAQQPPQPQPPVPSPQVSLVTPMPLPSVNMPPAPHAQTPQSDAVTALFAHSERLRQLSPSELAAEITALGDPGNAPFRQMQLALSLLHPAPSADTARALALLQRVVSNASPEALPVRPLARLLVQRLVEQRRAEDGLDRQSQQLRENQRRIEQLNDRLEAMRAIERSLGARPPATPNSVRPPAP